MSIHATSVQRLHSPDAVAMRTRTAPKTGRTIGKQKKAHEGISEGCAIAMISDAQPRTLANIESFENLVEETRGAGSLGDVGKVE